MKSDLKNIVLLALILLNVSCDGKETIATGDPSNLVVNISQSEDNRGLVLIQAIADNAVEFHLYIGSGNEPVAVNISGSFEHVFIQPGQYLIEVRAYGSSGRYIRRTMQITVDMSNHVPVENGYFSPVSYEGFEKVWNDEFDGINIDPADWVFETGTGCPGLCGWGNNELQYYRQENAWIEDDVLIIEARNEAWQGSNYTSARMKTQGRRSFMYGRVDIRALLPKGQGIWPALWMLGENISSVGWPKCGEIDIMEMTGGRGRDNQVHGTLHWDNNGHAYTGGRYTLGSGIFADEYHVFSIIWDEASIKWLVNDVQFHEISITPSHMTGFHEKFFFIFNVAVGGNWPGSPDETTVFPQQMRVDYIRVFQKAD
jgi:beta-glucanase (GH16 family)